MTQKIIGPAGSRRRHRTLVWCLVAALGVGLFAIAGASGTPPESAGLFELDKNATNDLTTVHVGVLKSQIRNVTGDVDRRLRSRLFDPAPATPARR